MSKLGALAAEFNCAVILIGHLNKANGGKGIYRGLGSIDIAAAARSVLAVSKLPEHDYRRAVVQVKSSLAPEGQAILFDLDPTQGFLWAGTCNLSADDILNYTSAAGQKANEQGECSVLLMELLAAGPLPATEIWEAMEANSFAESTVKRAKKALGVKSYREAGGWLWACQEYQVKKRELLDTLDILPS
jgi:hypothetical protein